MTRKEVNNVLKNNYDFTKRESNYKELFMPTTEELYKMQDKGANVYKYILAKAVESIAIDGTNKPMKGKLKFAYNYLKEDPEISHAICRMYPEEIAYSEFAQNDVQLCTELLKQEASSIIYNLNRLSLFEEQAIDAPFIIDETVKILSKELPKEPRFRFNYRNNKLLNEIFGGDLKLSCFMLDQTRSSIISNITKVEPYYAIKFGSDEIFKKTTSSIPNPKTLLIEGVNSYANRYGISTDAGSEYYGKDILTNKPEEVKRLLKCIKQRNK